MKMRANVCMRTDAGPKGMDHAPIPWIVLQYRGSRGRSFLCRAGGADAFVIVPWPSRSQRSCS